MERLKISCSVFILLAIGQIAAILAPIRGVFALLTGNHDRALEIAKGYDLLGNTVVNGVAGEYISARANRGRLEGTIWACRLCKILDKIDKDHCKKYGELPK